MISENSQRFSEISKDFHKFLDLFLKIVSPSSFLESAYSNRDSDSNARSNVYNRDINDLFFLNTWYTNVKPEWNCAEWLKARVHLDLLFCKIRNDTNGLVLSGIKLLSPSLLVIKYCSLDFLKLQRTESN